jgi:hypothetical protein
MDAKLREKLAQLYVLAQAGGTEGEEQNAARILQKLLRKYHLTIDDIASQDERPHFVEFKFRGPYERDLLFAVIRKVGAEDEKGSVTFYRTAPNVSAKLSFNLTHAQEAEARLMFDLYVRAFRGEMQRLCSAFIVRNQLFGKGPGRKWETLTKAEQEEMQRVWKLADGLDVVEVRRALPRGETG